MGVQAADRGDGAPLRGVDHGGNQAAVHVAMGVSEALFHLERADNSVLFCVAGDKGGRDLRVKVVGVCVGQMVTYGLEGGSQFFVLC